MVDKIERAPGSVIVDGITIKTEKQEIASANIIEVEVGTTGHCGGDSKYGCRTYMRIEDLGCTDMRFNTYSDNYGHSSVELVFGGDTEMDTFIEALEFAVETLKRKSGYICMSKKVHRQELFFLYLKEIISLYRRNGKLNGMTELQKKYHVTKITKSQFFECGLHEAAKDESFCLDIDYANKVYDYVLDKTGTAIAPKANGNGCNNTGKYL